MQGTAAEVASIQEHTQEQPPKKESSRTTDSRSIAAALKTKQPSGGTPKVVSKPAQKSPSRRTKVLPTERITFARQLDLLRGWAAASGPLRKVVTNNEVAKIIDMQPSTVSIANAFFSSIGLLTKTDGGFVPADDLTAFLRAYDWNKETAAQKLAPTLSKAWFYEALSSKLEFGPRAEADCLQDLADVSNAGPEWRPNLRLLLEYLAAAGLIQRDGTMVRKGSTNMSAATPPASSASEPAPTPAKQEGPPAAAQDAAKLMPSLFGTTEGQVQFNIAVKVNMGEFATWQADRIAAFFGGIAQVLAAKAKVEQSE